MKTRQCHLVFGWLAAVAAVLLVQPKPAFAVPVTITLGQVFTGSVPDGASPWLEATFEQTASNAGTLTLTSRLDANDFLQGLASPHATIGWAFHLGPALDSISCSGGSCAGNNALFGGSYNAGPVPGGFNLAFGWNSSSRFDGSDSAVYALTFGSMLSGSPFTPNTDGWTSVAHVQGIGPNAGCSGWIVAGHGTPGDSGACGTPFDVPHDVPEPGNLGMLGVGILLAGWFLGWRRRHV